MHKVLITARVIGWSAIALSMLGSTANSAPILAPQQPNVGGDLAQSDTDNLEIDRLEHPSNISTVSSQVRQVVERHRSKQRIYNTISPVNSCRAFPCLILSQDPHNLRNRFNNPIYKLTAYRDKTSDTIFQLNAVTGRGFTQTRNRYQSMTHAPLPDGSYSVAARIVRGTIREVGGTMIPIFPKSGFNPRMRRTALGIHWDPSFDRDKTEDGTSGCVGLTNKADYYRVRDFVLKYHPRSLEVHIDR